MFIVFVEECILFCWVGFLVYCMYWCVVWYGYKDDDGCGVEFEDEFMSSFEEFFWVEVVGVL